MFVINKFYSWMACCVCVCARAQRELIAREDTLRRMKTKTMMTNTKCQPHLPLASETLFAVVCIDVTVKYIYSS